MTLRARTLLALFLSLAATTTASAGPAMLVEPKTGLVLYAEDADYPWQPASLTKLMTAFLTFEAIRDGKLSLEDKLTCSANALAQEPSKLGLPIGAELKVEAAIKALIIKSANDVAIMLAERVAGSEAAFVSRMNETAKRLGMSNTHFVNPNGLPRRLGDKEAADQAVTTARDMATLAKALLWEFPQYADLYAMPSFKLGNRFMRSHNSLLRTYEGADGMKTGFVCASGYNVVASATKDGRQLVAVVLGEATGSARALRAAGLFEHGFSFYPWKALFSPTLETMPVATPEGAKAPDLRPVVCRGGQARTRKKKKNKKPRSAKAAENAKSSPGKAAEKK